MNGQYGFVDQQLTVTLQADTNAIVQPIQTDTPASLFLAHEMGTQRRSRNAGRCCSLWAACGLFVRPETPSRG